MGQPIMETKTRADISFEKNQTASLAIDFLRILNDKDGGLVPNGSSNQADSRANRVLETARSVNEDLIRALGQMFIDDIADKRSLLALLRGADPTAISPTADSGHTGLAAFSG